MKNNEVARQELLDLIGQAEILIPNSLKASESIDPMTNQPAWAKFERAIWKIGEEVRRFFIKFPALRKDEEIAKRIVNISTNPNAQRGRQSFILLLGYKNYATHASKIASQISDEDVRGQAINTLFKMQANQFVNQVLPYTSDSNTWIRNEAKRYTEQFS